jgi:hypothetical protein
MFTAARFQSFDGLDFSARKTDAPEKGAAIAEAPRRGRAR